MRRTPTLLAPTAALILAIAAPTDRASGQHRHGHRASPTRQVARPIMTPVPLGDRSPYIGTFRPSPTLIVATGDGSGLGYAPAGNYSKAASMSLYGPFSRLRALPDEVFVYSRGFDGRPIATSAGYTIEYPDPARYPDTTLVPTDFRVGPRRGLTVRSRFAPYLLGQQ